jgi:hypothetical protein
MTEGSAEPAMEAEHTQILRSQMAGDMRLFYCVRSKKHSGQQISEGHIDVY